MISRIMAILLVLLFSAVPLQADPLCEIEMTLRARVAYNLLVRALDLNAISARSLVDFAEASSWYDPIALGQRTENSLAARTSFRQLAPLLNSGERSQVKAAAKRFVQERNLRDIQVGEAVARTGEILYPHEFRILKYGEGKFQLSNGTITKGSISGRPVFLAMLVDNQSGESIDVLMDPFHHDPQAQLKQMKMDTFGRSGNQNAHIFSLESENFTGVLLSPVFASAETGEAVHGSRFGITHGYLGGEIVNSVIATNHQGDAILFALLRRDVNSQVDRMIEVNLTNPQPRPKILLQDKLSLLKIHQTRQGPIVTVRNSAGVLQVLNVNEGSWFDEIQPPDPQLSPSVAILDSEDQLKLVYFATDYSSTSRIDVFNLDNRSKRSKSWTSKERYVAGFDVVYAGGVPHVYFTDHNGFGFVNLNTMEDFTIPQIDSSVFMAKAFVWNRRTYLIWQSMGVLKIFDVLDRRLHLQMKFPGDLTTFQTFAYGRDAYVLTTNIDRSPILYKLNRRDVGTEK